jgi:hypothetical protein
MNVVNEVEIIRAGIQVGLGENHLSPFFVGGGLGYVIGNFLHLDKNIYADLGIKAVLESAVIGIFVTYGLDNQMPPETLQAVGNFSSALFIGTVAGTIQRHRKESQDKI